VVVIKYGEENESTKFLKEPYLYKRIEQDP
jgi:hypothetical protein